MIGSSPSLPPVLLRLLDGGVFWLARTSKPRKSSAVALLGKGRAEAKRPGRLR